jgi:hypothetical protein
MALKSVRRAGADAASAAAQGSSGQVQTQQSSNSDVRADDGPQQLTSAALPLHLHSLLRSSLLSWLPPQRAPHRELSIRLRSDTG